MANKILSSAEFVLIANMLANSATMLAGIATKTRALKSMSLFLTYTAKQMLASTIKHTTFVD